MRLEDLLVSNPAGRMMPLAGVVLRPVHRKMTETVTPLHVAGVLPVPLESDSNQAKFSEVGAEPGPEGIPLPSSVIYAQDMEEPVPHTQPPSRASR